MEKVFSYKNTSVEFTNMFYFLNLISVHNFANTECPRSFVSCIPFLYKELQVSLALFCHFWFDTLTLVSINLLIPNKIEEQTIRSTYKF